MTRLISRLRRAILGATRSARPRGSVAGAGAPATGGPRRLGRLARLRSLAAILLVAAVAGLAFGQQQFNLLAVDNELVDAAGPYYFIDHGNSSDAFAKALPFATALGVDVEFEDATKTLRFSDGRTVAELRATADVDAGLEKRSDVMTVDGAPFERPVPQAILVDGTSYVAIAPVAEAFGARTDWLPDERLLTVDLPAQPAYAEISVPRVGDHGTYVRVALDLPTDAPVLLAAGPSPDGPGGTLIARFPGGVMPPFERAYDHGPVEQLHSADLDGVAALVVRTRHPLDPSGEGFRFADTDSGTFYVDLGPELEGAAVAALSGDANEAFAIAPAEPAHKTVVIDAGHGGHDPGAVSSFAREEAIVLAVALEVRDRLEAHGVDVILTRDHDEFLELSERADFASTDRNVFVSIHANAADAASAHGIETYVFGRPLDPRLIELAIQENGGGELGRARTEEILAAGENIVRNILSENQLQYSRAFAETVQSYLIDETGAHDRGVKENALYVLRRARIPAILVEIGFVNHPEEGRRLSDPDYQSSLAKALSDGIIAFLGNGTAAARR